MASDERCRTHGAGMKTHGHTGRLQYDGKCPALSQRPFDRCRRALFVNDLPQIAEHIIYSSGVTFYFFIYKSRKILYYHVQSSFVYDREAPEHGYHR